MIPVKADSKQGWAPLCLGLVTVMMALAVALSMLDVNQPEVFRAHGLIPARLMSPESWNLLGITQQLTPFRPDICLHDGWAHCLVNVWWLWLMVGVWARPALFNVIYIHLAVFRISLFRVGPYSVFQIHGNPCIPRIPYSRKPPVEYCPGHCCLSIWDICVTKG